MKHRLPARNFRNRPCPACQSATPHDESGCAICAIHAANDAEAQRDVLLFWLVLAPIGIAGLVLAMCL